MPPPSDGQPSCFPNYQEDNEARAAAETLQFLQEHSDAEVFLKGTEKVKPMEATQQTCNGRHKRPSTGQVTQQLAPDTPAALISTISVNRIPPAVVHTDDLKRNKPKGGSPNPLLVDSCGLGKQAICKSTDVRNSGQPNLNFPAWSAYCTPQWFQLRWRWWSWSRWEGFPWSRSASFSLSHNCLQQRQFRR